MAGGTIDAVYHLRENHNKTQRFNCHTWATTEDSGPSFTSSTFKSFLAKNGIKHICTAPYHPSSNGLAERVVQTFKQSLRQIQGGSVKEN